MEFRLELIPLEEYEPLIGARGPLKWSFLGIGRLELDLNGIVLPFKSTSEEPADNVMGVWRFWDELVDVIPSVTEPVTPALVELLEQDEFWSWYPRLSERRAPIMSGISSLRERALGWLYSERRVSPMFHRPTLFFWRCGEDLHIRWCLGDCWSSLPEEAPFGKTVVSWQEFRRAVTHFDHILREEMERRLGLVLTQGALDDKMAELTLDGESLSAEQLECSTRLCRAFARSCPKRDWIAVYSALKTLKGFLALG